MLCSKRSVMKWGSPPPNDTTVMKAVGYNSTVVTTMVEGVGHNPISLQWLAVVGYELKPLGL